MRALSVTQNQNLLPNQLRSLSLSKRLNQK
jgi:hypothetical protein